MQHEEKKKLIAKHAQGKWDTWSPEVQIAIFTNRIENLKWHLEAHKKDNHSRRGIMLMVAKRRKLLNYLKRKSPDRYEHITKELNIRK